MVIYTRSLYAFGGLAVLCLLTSQAQAQFNSNLIVNSDAEAGGLGPTSNTVVAVPGWTTTSTFTIHQYGDSNYMLYTDPGPSNRGNNFFYGGPGGTPSTGTQNIGVTGGAGLINTGNVSFALSGWFGGYDGQDDNAVLTASFLDANNILLGSSSIGGVSSSDRNGASGLLFRASNGSVPVGTQNINVLLTMTRLQGSDNDGYADNLSLVLTASTASVPEPGIFTLFMGSGFSGAILLSRRRRK